MVTPHQLISPEAIAEEYVRLALAMDAHIPGYVDAYFGPLSLKEQAHADGLRAPIELSDRASALASAIANSPNLDAQRKDYLAHQALAMRTSLRLLQGEKLPLADEAESLFDVRPIWTDESVFDEAQRQLDHLLPPGDSLLERMTAFKRQFEISVDQARDVIPVILDHLRAIVRQRFPLPREDSVEIQFVQGKPWRAYNWYLGDCRSRIELNTDLPPRLDELVITLAHEVYPGHHTEASIKERRLLREAGRLEHSIALVNSPQSLIAEGIAKSALEVAMTNEDLIAWFNEDLLPRLGLPKLDVRRLRRIAAVMEDLLASADSNAAFLLHEKAATANEVVRYLQRYGLDSEQEARKGVEFMSAPLDHSYIFTYDLGTKLLKALFASKGDVTHWFTRLLSEPVTPSQVRQWML